MVGVELPRRKRGIKGTRPSTLAARPTYRMGVGEDSYSFWPDHPTLVKGNIGGFSHGVPPQTDMGGQWAQHPAKQA